MPRLLLAQTLALFALVAAPVHGDDADAIETRIVRAKADYKAELENLNREMLDSLEKRAEAAGKDGNKELIDKVKAESDAFTSKGELPKLVSTSTFQSGRNAAQFKLQGAYKKAIADYLTARMDEKASTVEVELKAFEKSVGLGDADGSKVAGKAKEPVVLSTWMHEVKGRGPAFRQTLKLYSNGKIDSPDSPNTWQVKGKFMILTWPNPKAPGGEWKDVCNLSPNGKSYNGKNQDGATISGVRLSLGDSDKKK